MGEPVRPGAPMTQPSAPSLALEPGDEEDFRWILAFNSGKEEGFNRLVLRHKDRIYGLCLRLLARDPHEAEDAAQETFVKVYHALRDFRMESKFSSWLYRIAVNTCKNRMASRSYREARNRQDPETADADMARSALAPAFAPALAPDQVLEAKGKREKIENAIARLPEEQRTLVVLRDVEGRSYEEIAEATGLNPGTVKSRLNRGRGQLKEWLRGYFLPLLLLTAGSLIRIAWLAAWAGGITMGDADG
jgi:RNA polymerase sigma-70 factor, ECF subfamily